MLCISRILEIVVHRPGRRRAFRFNDEIHNTYTNEDALALEVDVSNSKLV